MNLYNIFTNNNALLQTVTLAALGRSFVATLTLLFLLLSLWFSWGEATFHFHWESVIFSYLAILILSIFTLVYRRVITSEKRVFLLLSIDASLWFFLLKETGGAMNPANSYFLVLLCLSALSLNQLKTAALFFFIIGLYTFMMFDDKHTLHSMMGWHLWGMWLSFFSTALIITLSIHYLSTRIQAKDRAINQFREKTTRSEQLIMMGTMAASTAHEIATPLSTIAMLAENLTGSSKTIILEQVKRCKQSLEQLKNIPSEHDPLTLKGSQFLNGLENDLLLIRPQAKLGIHITSNPTLLIPLTLKQALLALLVNAIDAAKVSVNCLFEIEGDQIIWRISHDGDPVEEPFLATFSRTTSKEHGLGIGYFLANASIEQLGGSVQIANKNDVVITVISIPATSLTRE